MNAKFGDDWLKGHRKNKRPWVMHGRIPPMRNVKLYNVLFFWVTIPALAFGWPTLWLPVSMTFFNCLSLSAHFTALQSAQIVITLAIRSFIKELHSNEGNKGDGGEHSRLRSLHGTVTGALQNGLQGLLNSQQKCFWQEANCVGCKKM